MRRDQESRFMLDFVIRRSDLKQSEKNVSENITSLNSNYGLIALNT